MPRSFAAWMLCLAALATPTACTLWPPAPNAPTPNATGSASPTDSTSADTLTGTRWTLVRVEAPGRVIAPETSERNGYWVAFGDAGDVTARNACNDCSGTFTRAAASDGSGDRGLSIDVHCQEMACGPGQPFLGHGRILRGATAYRVENDQLLLTTTYDPTDTAPGAATPEGNETSLAVYEKTQTE